MARTDIARPDSKNRLGGGGRRNRYQKSCADRMSRDIEVQL